MNIFPSKYSLLLLFSHTLGIHLIENVSRRNYLYSISRIRKNLFIHIARIPIGDSPRVHPNILKCSLHSPVAKGIRLVVFATRAMVCDTPTHYLILNSLASARGRVILRSHFLILLLLIILISLYILTYFSLLQ